VARQRPETVASRYRYLTYDSEREPRPAEVVDLFVRRVGRAAAVPGVPFGPEHSVQQPPLQTVQLVVVGRIPGDIDSLPQAGEDVLEAGGTQALAALALNDGYGGGTGR
jgi:hypothetical protein